MITWLAKCLKSLNGGHDFRSWPSLFRLKHEKPRSVQHSLPENRFSENCSLCGLSIVWNHSSSVATWARDRSSPRLSVYVVALTFHIYDPWSFLWKQWITAFSFRESLLCSRSEFMRSKESFPLTQLLWFEAGVNHYRWCDHHIAVVKRNEFPRSTSMPAGVYTVDMVVFHTSVWDSLLSSRWELLEILRIGMNVCEGTPSERGRQSHPQNYGLLQ